MTSMKIESKHTVKGKYMLRKLDEAGNIIYESDWFDNLITNAGLDMLGGAHGAAAFQTVTQDCYVGTGTATPSVGDTTLTTYLANTSTMSPGTQSFVSGSPSYYTNTFTYTFAVGVATGTISEIGVGITTNNTGPIYTLFSHALIVTSGGTPTTITILSNESLQVLYQLQLYNDTTTNTYSVSISGTTYTGSYLLEGYGTRGQSGNSYSVGFPLASNGTGSPLIYLSNGTISGTVSGFISGTVLSYGALYGYGTYTVGTYTNTITWTIPVGDGNLSGGISAFAVEPTICAYQFSVSPAIPKDSNHILTLEISFSWASGI